MITIIHGENNQQSHNFLFSLLQRARHQNLRLIEINPQNVSPEKIAVSLENNLFGQKNLLLIRAPQKFPPSLKKQLFSSLLPQIKHEVIIFSEKKLSPSFLKNFPQAQIRYFKKDALIFRFLDYWGEGNKQAALKTFFKISQRQEENLLIYFLIQRLEDFLFIKKNQLQQLHVRQSWQKQKLVRQAKNFSLTQIKNILVRLAELDYQQKTGQLPYPLSFALELFIKKT